MDEVRRKIYIDCGAWRGYSILAFKKHYGDYFDMYAFECHPKLKRGLENLSRKMRPKKFNFIDKAVWICDEKVHLYPGPKRKSQSSSVMFSKRRNVCKNNPVIVCAIDFSKWILDNFNKDDYIICKMNIEGAEYDVLEKMLKDGSIKYINRLYVQWHYKKLKDFSVERHNKIKGQISKIIKLFEWNFIDIDEGNPFV